MADWLTVTDAATQIGCSKRTIERLAAAKKLEQRLRPQAGSPAVAVYNPDDVRRITAERRPGAVPFVLPAGSDHPNGNGQGILASQHETLARLPAGDEVIRGLAVLITKALQSPPSPPMADKVAERSVLTLDEAVAMSGWSRTFLVRAIKDGRLKAEKDGAWKIRRKDLELL